MKFLKFITMSFCLSMLCFATSSCNNGKKTTSEKQKTEIEEASKLETDSEQDRIGGFLPKIPYNNKTVNLNDFTVTIRNFDVYGFPKKMETYGTLFAIMEGVPNEFVNEVAVTFHQMFPKDASLDLKKQEEVLSAMLQYKSLIPVLKGRYESLGEDFEQSMEKLSSDYSVCDIIMYKDGTGRQTMEVVEHLLHFITSIGLHLNSPKEWSFSDADSEAAEVMNKAIELGLYDISGYADMLEEKEIHQRVIVQEFAYWLISTYWNLQEPYGNIQEREWNIDNKKQLLEKLPEGYNLVKSTIDSIMTAPSKEALDKFIKYN